MLFNSEVAIMAQQFLKTFKKFMERIHLVNGRAEGADGFKSFRMVTTASRMTHGMVDKLFSILTYWKLHLQIILWYSLEN